VSRIRVVATGIPFRNPLPGHRAVSAHLPFIQPLSEQELICVYRRSSAFYSPDGVLAKTRSRDGGKTWHEEGLVRDTRPEDRPCSYSAPFLSKLRDDSLALVAFRVDVSNPDRLMVNPDTGGFLPTETLLFRSMDKGRTWSAPQVIALPEGIIAYLAGAAVELNDGSWFLPFDNGKAYEDPNAVKAVMFGLFSRDQGRTWGELIRFADGAEQQKAHWHGRVTRLLDGRLFALLWTQDLSTGKFIDLHRTVSDVTGRQWSVPEPTGIPGQTSWVVDLGQGRVFAAYTVRDLPAARHAAQADVKPPGIRGILSEDGGRSWDKSSDIVLWDATDRETIGVAAKDTYPVSHDVIAFGRPQAARMPDGDVLASFWCTEACVTHIRFARLRVE